MSWTSVGFDGTINEAQWAGLAGLLGNGYVAAGNSDCLVTAVAGARSVSVAAGSLYGDGVLSTNSAPETVAMTTPVNGQWYVIALRRTWATNTAALVAIAGATTTTTTPTAPPTSFPTLNTNVGVLTDQPIAWAWCNSANTTVVVYDIRLKAVKSLPPVVANANERDAKFMSPTQGLQVWRDDLGAVETYYGLYNSSTNPGGRDSAGWYTTNRAGGLIPVRPTTATFVSGTGTVNGIGTASFSNVTYIQLDGILNSKFSNYRVEVNVTKGGGNGVHWLYAQLCAGGTVSATNYGSSGCIYWGTSSTTAAAYVDPAALMLTQAYYADASRIVADFNMFNPNLATPTRFTGNASGNTSSAHNIVVVGGMHDLSTAYDGVRIAITGGTISGTVTVYGWNEK